MKSGAIPDAFLKGIGALLLLCSLSVTVVTAFILGITFWLSCHKTYPANYHQELINLIVLGGCGLICWLGIFLLKKGGTRLVEGVNKPILSVIGIFILALIGLCLYLIPVLALVQSMSDQLEAGRRYMDSLTPQDIQSWIDRSKALMNNPHSDDVVPEDLRKLYILRVDAGTDRVSYVWLGGMDHTELIVERQNDGTFQVTAQYDDEDSKVIWPKS